MAVVHWNSWREPYLGIPLGGGSGYIERCYSGRISPSLLPQRGEAGPFSPLTGGVRQVGGNASLLWDWHKSPVFRKKNWKLFFLRRRQILQLLL